MTEGKAAGMPEGRDHKPVAGHAPLSFPRHRASRDDAMHVYGVSAVLLPLPPFALL